MPRREKPPELSIVIPLYNEALCLEKNVAQILAYLKSSSISHEIVLVDDGSTDDTKTVCHGLTANNGAIRLISSPENYGKGHAVKTGMLQARGEYAIFADADLAVPIHYIGPCLEHLRNGDPIVIGSRHLPESSFEVPEGPLRQLFGEVFRRFAKFSLGLKVSDITCGFKGFHRAVAFDVFSRSIIDRWGYDAEVIFLAHKLHYSIREIPVDWYHSFDSKVRVGMDSVRTLVEIIRIYHCYLNHGYRIPANHLELEGLQDL